MNHRFPGHVSTAIPGGRSNVCDARTGTRRTIRDNVGDGDEAAPACGHHRWGLRWSPVRKGTARSTGRRRARRPAQLPPLHPAAVPSRELPAESFGDRGAVAQGAARRGERPLPHGRCRARRLRGQASCTSPTEACSHTTTWSSRPAASRTTTATTRSLVTRWGLKDLGEALQLRNHVLECLEQAACATDTDERRRLLTFCIVGGGPTGVEYAGALAELVRLVLPHEYPEIPPSEVSILLLEGADRLLTMFVPRLSNYARRELERRGIDVRTNTLVASADDKGVVLHDGAEVPTATMVWTAGVRPNDIVHDSPAPDRGRRPPTRHRRARRVRDRRRRGDARPSRQRLADGVAAGDASRALRRAPHRRRRCQAAVPLPRQGHAGDDRSPVRGRAGGPAPLPRIPRVGRLARRAPLLPDRVREPPPGPAALGLVLRPARSPRPGHSLGASGVAGMPRPADPFTSPWPPSP